MHKIVYRQSTRGVCSCNVSLKYKLRALSSIFGWLKSLDSKRLDCVSENLSPYLEFWKHLNYSLWVPCLSLLIVCKTNRTIFGYSIFFFSIWTFECPAPGSFEWKATVRGLSIVFYNPLNTWRTGRLGAGCSRTHKTSLLHAMLSSFRIKYVWSF